MPLLAEISSSDIGDSPYVNFIVIPGFAGSSLSDRTCPHFGDWLGWLVRKCSSRARSWVYNHGIRLDILESWDKYCTTGDALLQQLLSIQDKVGDDETIVLIGHKLGCYILKKALVEAWNNGHKDEYRQLLDMVETIMLVGEPSLNPKKPDEWINLISECVSQQHGLPKRLASGLTVGCLQRISDDFETVLLHSTLFDVCGSNKPKRRFRMRRMEHDGCIGCASVHVRLFTTSSEEILLESGPGDTTICPFHPKSAHFPHLLTLNPTPQGLPQIEAPNTGVSKTGNPTNGTRATNTKSIPTRPELDSSGEVLFATDGVVGRAASSTDESNPPTSEPELDQKTSTETDIEEEDVSQPTSPVDYTEDPDVGSIEDISESEVEHVDAATNVPSSEERQLCDTSPRERKKYFTSSIPARDDLFFGYSNILKQVEQVLLGNRDNGVIPTSVQPMQANLVWLSGPEGMGKSSIAVEFAYRFMPDFEYVIWLRATSEASLAKYCHDSAVALGLINGRTCQDHEVSRGRLMQYLGDSGTSWLFIFDDCDYGVDISRYIPNDRAVSVIATGRRGPPVTDPMGDWSVIDVPGFTPEEAAQFLISRFKGKIRTEDSEAICAAAVHYHASPLVCRQLATWSTREAISIKDINSLLNVKGQLLTFRFKPVHTVMSSVMGRLDNPATSLLAGLCFYDGTRVPKRLVLTSRSWKIARSRNSNSKPEKILSGAATVLWRSALLDIDESQTEETYHIHRSVQDWTRTQLDDKTWRNSFEDACENISYQWPSKRKMKNIIGGYWEDFDNLHTHVHHLAHCLTQDRLSDQVTTFDPGDKFKRLLVYHNWYNSRRGNYAEDRGLHNLTQFLLTTTRNRSAKDSHPALPRRCILVMDEHGPTTRLVDTQGCHAPYIALSYTWGYSPTPRINYVTRSSQSEKEIDISALPKQINDAVRFTRNMGVKYLWVDALCIDQDNPTEVSEELDRSVEYYSNSSIIICKLQPPSSISRLKWKASQRLDIPPYSILRSGTRGDARAETFWVKASVLQESCFTPTDKRVGSKPYWNVNIVETTTMSGRDPQELFISWVRGGLEFHMSGDGLWRRWLTLVAGTLRVVDAVRSMLVKRAQAVVRLGEENPWVVCCFLCLWFATVSFYLGTCMVADRHCTRGDFFSS